MGLLARVGAEQRASIENPSTSLADPDVWLFEAFGATQTAAGKHVSHRNALKLSAVWACTKVISEDVAKLPLPIYRRLDRGKDRAREHPLYRVLQSEFNPEMSAYNGRRTLEAHVLNWGNAFAEIERNGAGEIVALWPLLPDRTRAERVDGRKVIVTRISGREEALDASSVLHIPGLGFDGLRGYSVINHARQAIGAALAAEEFGASFFGGGAVPGGIIKRKDQVSETAQQRIRRSWNKVHQGLSGSQRIAILDEGMEYEKIGIPPEDAQFIATRQHSVEDVIRFYRVPPHKVQHLLHAGVRANVEAENISYVTDTLQSWLVCWEQEINRSLFTRDEQAEFFAEHLIEGLLRGDSAARGEFYTKGINNAWLTPNEAREAENRNPLPGGDRLFVPLNLMPLDSPLLDEVPGDVGEDDDGADDLDGPEENARTSRTRLREVRALRSATARHRLQRTHVRAFEAAAGRVIQREAEAVAEMIDETLSGRGVAGEARDTGDFLADVERFYEGFGEVVMREFGPLLSSYGELVRGAIADELGQPDEPITQFDGFVDQYTRTMAARHVTKSRRQLQAIVRDAEPGDVPDALAQNLTRWQDERPAKIALTETVRAGGAFAKQAYVLLGVLVLRWVTFGESCPYCRRLNGKVVGVDESFASKGDIIEPDEEANSRLAPEQRADPMTVKATVGHPPLHGGCDCGVAAGL